jgi:putative heme-binding domain-containing protein
MSAELATAFEAEMKDENAPEDKRLAAAGELVDLRADDLAPANAILDLIGPRVAPEFANKLLETAGRTHQKDFGEKLAQRVAGFTPGLRATGVRVLLSKNDWVPALLLALDENKISLGDLSADQKQALVSSTNRQIASRARKILSRGGALPSADRQKVVEDFMPLTNREGDPAAGKLVFTKQCAKCHTHTAAAADGKVGPDLSGFAVHPKQELLIAILDPSRSVEGNFKAYTVTTDDGRQITGLLGSESKTAVELVDADGKRQSILRENIDQLVPSQK